MVYPCWWKPGKHEPSSLLYLLQIGASRAQTDRREQRGNMVTSMQVLRAPWAPQHPGARNPEWFFWDKESARGGTRAGKTGSTWNPPHISQM